MLDYTNSFSPYYCEKNGKTILNLFQKIKRWKKIYCVICGKYRKFGKRKKTLEKTLVLSVICSKCKNKEEKYLKKKDQLRYWRFLV